MKKLILCAFALVVVSGSAFASNGEPVEKEVLEQDKPCKFKLRAYHPDTEEEIASEIYTGREGKDDCFRKGLIEQEKWAEKYPEANISMEILK
ncbi:hypothetical protein [Myroides odoratus]|uniref:hypothetical protein n=1 Tax=Myroides odoratus TaxID=256 RepID=UPI000765F9DF|nr:hypothetical protein [Myroides odoratus]